jgi:hypothetical protein
MTYAIVAMCYIYVGLLVFKNMHKNENYMYKDAMFFVVVSLFSVFWLIFLMGILAEKIAAEVAESVKK